MVNQLEPGMKIESKEIEKFLDIKFNKLLVHKIISEKYFFDNPNKPEKIKRLKNLNISIDQYDRWVRGNTSKHKNGTLPHNKNTLLNLAGVMDIDPFLLYQFQYHKFQDLIESLDNVFIINMLNWNDIHKSLLFMVDFFKPCKEFPKESVYKSWTNSINESKGWISKSFCNSSEIKNDKTQIIDIYPDLNLERQVFHLACKKIKSIKSLEFWQQYKIIIVIPLKDLETYPDCEFKKNIFKTRGKNLKLAMYFNISGSFKYYVIEENKPLKIKLTFQEAKKEYKIASFHNFITNKSI